MALGFEPTTFSRESPPITTRPGLPPNLFENFKNKTQSVFCLHLSRVNFLEYNPPHCDLNEWLLLYVQCLWIKAIKQHESLGM